MVTASASASLKIEICCRCGFVHRDDRHAVRQAKLHYHWASSSPLARAGQVVLPSGAHLVPTVCMGCVDEYGVGTFMRSEQLETPHMFRTERGYNATLPLSAIHESAVARLERAFSEFAIAMVHFGRTKIVAPTSTGDV